MTALHRDLSVAEIWQRSFERSRRRRATAPKLRRQAVRRNRASWAMAAAMLAGPAARFAGAQTNSEGSGSGGTWANRVAEVMLRLGSAGEAVKAVQGELGVAASGVFDASTEEAVRDFQARAGLVVDGIVGPQTLRVLFGWVRPAAFADAQSTSEGGRAPQPEPEHDVLSRAVHRDLRLTLATVWMARRLARADQQRLQAALKNEDEAAVAAELGMKQEDLRRLTSFTMRRAAVMAKRFPVLHRMFPKLRQ